MHPVQSTGMVYYQFENMRNGYGRLNHGVFARLGGVSRPPWHSLNVGGTVGDDPQSVRINSQRIYHALDLRPERRVTARQVGGARVACLPHDAGGQILPATDALLTNIPDMPLVMRFADCLPIVLYDPRCNVAGLVHAGWKGTVGRIVQAAVRSMSTQYGCRPDDIRAGIGPGIGPCCYEVGPDVIEHVGKTLPFRGLLGLRKKGHAHLDLWEANRALLAEAGVAQIEVAGLCTACHTEEWFSHRGENGRTGRFAALVALRETGS